MFVKKALPVFSGFYTLCLLFILTSCNTQKKTTATTNQPKPKERFIPEQKVYQASNTLYNDVQHVKLEVSFNWDKKYLYGKEYITLKPHFYATDKVQLNARGMDINVVTLVEDGKTTKKLNYDYRNDTLFVTLDRTYTRNEKYTLFINYVAKPDELKEVGGSAAITSDKGLYFINADKKDPNKPQQLWTQGETQSNSVWFPIIDSPNQKMTQEISITVDNNFVTLCNGLLVSSVFDNEGRTRTDTWKQTLPAAPYLTMMAISNFKIVKDKWRSLDVNYYVDAEFEQYAKQIFGNTPEMLEFYSKTLGVDYPWEKFHQVVVHDYVSGAMENTSAVLHGEFLQRTTRQLLDNTNEDVIAHELFHQWFGDLVTCESWSNIPLNESFATYGEYLWNEHKYGADEADYGCMQDLSGYLNEAKYKQVNLIRFNYNSREDMFDGHSYPKGGRVLHMLRKYVGDDAFFASLKKYLTDNRFKAVEIHNLRLAFEETTGEDLNWFFNQWFLDKGHPDIEINYQWNDSLKKEIVTIEQKQDFEKTPMYKLPLQVDIYEGGKKRREKITVKSEKDVFFFDCTSKPDLVNVDAEKQLLCTKTDNHTTGEWIFQYQNAPLFLDRHEALSKLCKNYEANSDAGKIVRKAMDDKHWAIRKLAIKNCGALAKADAENTRTKLISILNNDKKSSVRSEALSALNKYFDDERISEVYKNAFADSSFNVMTNALEYYIDKNPSQIGMLKQFEDDNTSELLVALSGIYAQHGDDSNVPYAAMALDQAKGFSKFTAIQNYGKLLERCKPETIEANYGLLTDAAKNSASNFMRMQGKNTLTSLSRKVADKQKELAAKPETVTEAEKYQKLSASITATLDELKKTEKDKKKGEE